MKIEFFDNVCTNTFKFEADSAVEVCECDYETLGSFIHVKQLLMKACWQFLFQVECFSKLNHLNNKISDFKHVLI